MTCKNNLRSGEHPASSEKLQRVCLCVCARLLLQEVVVFYFHSVNLCGPVWEGKGDKGESSKEEVNDIRELENERETLNERERRSVKNGERVGGVEVRGKR